MHCVCNRSNNAFAYGRTDRCPFCVYNAKTCQSGETSGRVSDEESVTFSATNLEALHLTLARGMESVPQTHETSREVQAASTTNSANVDISAPSPVIKSGNAPAEGKYLVSTKCSSFDVFFIEICFTEAYPRETFD